MEGGNEKERKGRFVVHYFPAIRLEIGISKIPTSICLSPNYVSCDFVPNRDAPHIVLQLLLTLFFRQITIESYNDNFFARI